MENMTQSKAVESDAECDSETPRADAKKFTVTVTDCVGRSIPIEVVHADDFRQIERELKLIAQWIPVEDRLPIPDEWVIVYNGKWRGIGRHRPLEDNGYMQESERWQDEHAEYIEHLGPRVTHWQPLQRPPVSTPISES
jgi:hypothetical protein